MKHLRPDWSPHSKGPLHPEPRQGHVGRLHDMKRLASFAVSVALAVAVAGARHSQSADVAAQAAPFAVEEADRRHSCRDLTSAVNITNFESFGAKPLPCALCADFAFDVDRYLMARGDARITNWATWVANATFRDDASRAGAENWLHFVARGAESAYESATHHRQAPRAFGPVGAGRKP